jgi:hypothetical protein
MTDPFNILAAEYRPMVLAYLRAMVRDAHLAEDLTQETMIAAHESLDGFEPGGTFGRSLAGNTTFAPETNPFYSGQTPLRPLVYRLARTFENRNQHHSSL